MRPYYKSTNLILIFSVLLLHSSVQAQTPAGQLKTVPCPEVADSTLNFRYCPPGELLIVKGFDPVSIPEKKNEDEYAKVVLPINGFYILETELSVKQYLDTMGAAGKQTLENIKRRLGLASQEDPNVILEEKNLAGNYPIRGLTPEEANEICIHLNQFVQARASSVSLDRISYSIPSPEQWQYACRAESDPAKAVLFPHINQWFSLDKQDNSLKNRIGDCEEIWKEMNMDQKFTGSETQIFQIINYAGSNNKEIKKAQDIYRLWMRQSLFEESKLKSIAKDDDTVGIIGGDIRQVGQGEKKNKWQITDMHENVKEYVVDSQNGVQNYFFAGGSCSDSLSLGGNIQWQNFLIWSCINNSWSNLLKDYNNDPDSLLQDQKPGVRLVCLQVPSDDWLLYVRQEYRKDKNSLETNREKLRKLTSVEEFKEMNDKIDFFAQVNSTDIDESQQKSVMSRLFPHSEFFSIMNTVLK